MRVSLEKACELLRTWRSAGQAVDVALSGGRSSVSFLVCSGKIADVGFNEFVVGWGERELVRISLAAKFEMPEDKGVLRLLFPEGEVVVLTEGLS